MPYLHQYAGNSSGYTSKSLTPFGKISMEKQRREKEREMKDMEWFALSHNNADKRKHEFDIAGRQLELEGMQAATKRFTGLVGALGTTGAGYLNSVADRRDMEAYFKRRDAALGGSGGGTEGWSGVGDLLPDHNPGEAPWGSYEGEL
jgi:hypothetical protein